MPAIVALAIRAIIQMIVTLGLIKFAESFVLPLLNKALQETMKLFGVSEQQAEDIMANELVAFVESVGIGALVLRSKLPLKIADRLGFTSRGWSTRALTGKAGAATTAARASAIPIIQVAAVAEAQAIPLIASRVGASAITVKSVLTTIASVVGVPVGVLFVVGNFLDFASWNGSAYQGTFQKVFALFGLQPDKPFPKSSTLSAEVFDRVYGAYKEEGATFINDPYKGQTVPFTRQNMIDLLDRVGAALLLEIGSASAKQVIGVTTALIQYTKVAAPVNYGTGGVGALSVDSIISRFVESSKRPDDPQVRVFTGLIAGGRLGDIVKFDAREDDIIDSLDDLLTAARNNLVPFLGSLYGRMAYELKVVPTVVDKDGIARTGAFQTVTVGYASNGTPKIKTIVNRWAVLKVYVFTKRGSRVLIDDIILGPVDSVKLAVSPMILEKASAVISIASSTDKIKDIAAVVTSQPITISSPPVVPLTEINKPPIAPVIVEPTGGAIIRADSPVEERDIVVYPWHPVGMPPTGSPSVIFTDGSNHYRIVLINGTVMEEPLNLPAALERQGAVNSAISRNYSRQPNGNWSSRLENVEPIFAYFKVP